LSPVKTECLFPPIAFEGALGFPFILIADVFPLFTIYFVKSPIDVLVLFALGGFSLIYFKGLLPGPERGGLLILLF